MNYYDKTLYRAKRENSFFNSTQATIVASEGTSRKQEPKKKEMLNIFRLVIDVNGKIFNFLTHGLV